MPIEREIMIKIDNDILYHETKVSKGIMTADIAFISKIVVRQIGRQIDRDRQIEKLVVAKALDGQRYALPICLCMWV